MFLESLNGRQNHHKNKTQQAHEQLLICACSCQCAETHSVRIQYFSIPPHFYERSILQIASQTCNIQTIPKAAASSSVIRKPRTPHSANRGLRLVFPDLASDVHAYPQLPGTADEPAARESGYIGMIAERGVITTAHIFARAHRVPRVKSSQQQSSAHPQRGRVTRSM